MGDSVGESVGASVGEAVVASVGEPVVASVGASVGDRAGASVGDGVVITVSNNPHLSSGQKEWIPIFGILLDFGRGGIFNPRLHHLL